MGMSLSELYLELAEHALAYRQPFLAHISQMAAREACGKDIPPFVLGWNVLGIWDWDAVNDLTYLDENCADLFNVDHATARKGLPISEYLKAIHPDDAPRVSDSILAALKKGGPYESRYRVISKGKIRNIVARGDCTHDAAGKAVRFPGYILELPTILS
jgi:PAS domain-containing protein